MKVIQRQLQSYILETLQSFPVVYINGPRQAGKTTLVQELLAKEFSAKFISFDDALERAAAMRNPYSFIKELGTPLILDEVQRVPELFRPLKKLVDEQRRMVFDSDYSANGHYLLTGSANLMAIPELANAMVGRMATLTLLPLSGSEISHCKSNFLERCFAKDFSEIKTENIPLTQIIQEASYPGLAQVSNTQLDHWFRNYVQKITLEDPRHIYNLEKAERMPMLLQSLAARAGNLINDAQLGREIAMNAITTRNYRSLLANTFVTHTLKPWYRNITKRLVKSHKLYFYDTMLLCHLLQSTPKDLAKNQPHRFGHVLENFVLSEMMKANFSSGEKVDISFYRSKDGKEIDFVLEHQHKLIAVEVKNAESISNKDLAGIKELQENTGKDFYCGIVLCNTSRVITYDKDIYLLPLSALWQ